MASTADPTNFQALIDRLQREAVEEGERRARAIVEEAEQQATNRLRDAEAQAAALREQAERDAEATLQRGMRALEQAARDLLIALRQAIDEVFDGLIQESLDEVLTSDLIADMLVRMSEAYAARGGRERRMSVLLSADDLEVLARLYTKRLHDRLPQGIELHLGSDLRKGFRVALTDEGVEHDLSLESIAEALGEHLRPQLAELLPRAAAPSLGQRTLEGQEQPG